MQHVFLVVADSNASRCVNLAAFIHSAPLRFQQRQLEVAGSAPTPTLPSSLSCITPQAGFIAISPLHFHPSSASISGHQPTTSATHSQQDHLEEMKDAKLKDAEGEYYDQEH
jgi:hypothetical protein